MGAVFEQPHEEWIKIYKRAFVKCRTAEMTEVARRVCSASPKVAYIVDAGEFTHLW